MSEAGINEGRWAISSPLHNRLAEEDRAIHGWYRFVLSFPPHLVREYLNKFGAEHSSTVLDPFCGTGTTMVEAKKLGVSSVGVEANPMAAFASRVKVDWTPDPHALRLAARTAAAAADAEITKAKFQESDILVSAVREVPTLFGLLDLDDEQRKLIISDSISPRPLHRVLILNKYMDGASSDLRDHLKLALGWSLVNGIGNVRFGPEVGITPPKLDVNAVEIWLGQVDRMADDLCTVGSEGAPSRVIQGDARSAFSDLADASVDFVFTSPPYPNEKDYTRTTRLESVVLGFIKNRADLRRLKQGLLRSNTRNVYVADDDDHYVADVPEILRIADEIEARRMEMNKTSGFERLYHRVTKLYFGGMARHLSELKRVLKPGAKLGYVVGDQASYLRVMIRTGCLVAQLAERQGYQVESIDLFRTRYATATRDQLREEVVVLRWPGG
jgi:DNA modification methylase